MPVFRKGGNTGDTRKEKTYDNIRLGDRVEQALSAVGISKERVKKVLGQDCGCGKRQIRLNELSSWAEQLLTNGMENAAGVVSRMLGKKPEELEDINKPKESNNDEPKAGE